MKKLLLLSLTMLSLFGCTQFEDLEQKETTELEETQSVEAQQTRAGTTALDNPYSLTKVQQAYNAVRSSLGLPAKTIEASEHYVRFFAADSVQYMTLCDLGVELFEYPMHLELTNAEEQAYADQDPAEGMWFWSTVYPDFVYPQGIQHEKLDDIYIQQVGQTATRAGESQMDDDVWSNVLDKAFELSGYEPEPETRGAKWYPSATVTYITDHPLYDGEEYPLEGVKVRVSQGLNWAVVYTDANGSTGDIERNSGRLFKKPVDYKIKWDNDRWNIRTGRNGQAKTWGPKNSRSPWPVVFQGDGIDTKYATAHKALYNYVYKSDNWASTRNLTISGINKLNTGVIDKAHRNGVEGKFSWFNPLLGMNTVRIWLKNSNDYYPNYRVEKTMYHELGHASHYTALRRDHGSGHNILLMPTAETGEPFPDFVSYCFMNEIYPGNEMEEDAYLYYGLGEWLYWQGFTPAQIEDIMCEEDMAAWRRVAKNMNVTNPAIVDMLFDNPYRIVRVNLTNPITGPDKPAVNTSAAYSVPTAANMPADVEFTGWTVAPASGYTTIGGLAGRTLNIRFTAEGTYTITANFTLPDGSTHSVTKTVVAEELIIPISGPDNPSVNTNATYTIPTDLPAGVVFDGWTVSPSGSFMVIGGTVNHNLTIQFTAKVRRTITANFTLPDGTSYSTSKEVASKPELLIPTQPSTPKIVGTTFSSGGRFTVTNPTSGATYLWELDGQMVTNAGSNGHILNVSSGGNPIVIKPIKPLAARIATARCRSKVNGVTSAWSNRVSISIP